MAPDSKKVLTTYLRRLTNLSSNNRSLFLPRLPKDQFLDIQEWSQLNGEKAFSIIEALITKSKKTICAVADPRMESVNEVSKKIKQLQRIDHFIFEERGSQDLHVGWPIVEGKFNDGTLVRCPLLFFPVELKLESSRWVILPRENSLVQFNKSFLLSYAFYNNLKADESLLEETFDESDQDSTVFRTQLYQLLQKSSLEINFNSENYRDELIPFLAVKKQEFEEANATGKLKLIPQAVIGIFPQAGSFLVPDYLQLLEKDQFTDLVELFTKTAAEKPVAENLNFLSAIKEDKVYAAFPMDTWQENALKGIKLGHSLVIQGPPGTGKSQLICNLISDAIAQGRRVLVVCQKRAALDVVYQRLQEESLADFIALVHDFKNDRKEIFEKIARQINRVDEFRSRNSSLDTIYLERTFLQSSRRIDQITEELEEFRKALFDETECGKSIKELYLTSSLEEPAIGIKQELPNFPFTRLDDFLRKLKSYSFYAKNFLQEEYTWRDRKSFSNFSIADFNVLKDCLKEIPDLFRQLNFQIETIIGQRLDLDQCSEFLEKEHEAEELMTIMHRHPVYDYFKRMCLEPDEETSTLWLSNIERVVNECFTGEGPEISVATHQLGQLQEALRRSMKARRSLIGLIRWELFSKDKFLIQRALVANGLASDKNGFLTLEAKLDSRLNLEHNISKLRSRPWLLNLPETLKQEDYKKWFGNQLIAIHGKHVFSSMRGLATFIDPQHHAQEDFTLKIKKLYQSLSLLKERQEKWRHYFTAAQLQTLTQQPDQYEIISKTLQKDFDALCEFDRLREKLEEDEKLIIQRLSDHRHDWDFDELKKLFINSLSLAWIEHLENKHPELRKVSSGQMALAESELREHIITKQKISTDILLLKARESVISDLEFNRLNNRVTYRDLLHQATKKKKIWPIRKLITEFEREVYKLLPCWLASPESVSALFPLKESFDLVIFDEASQCYAERGIPSLYRGKQVVVAGDSKQLRPGDFYHVRWEDEDDDHPDQEVDSLLELTSRYWPSLQLRGHYRSQAPELIEFSNLHFYDGKLQLLPEFKFDRQSPVIEYVKVEGSWQNNTNVLEAHTVSDCVQRLLAEDPTRKIGVVTFNAPQQSLILDVLEDEFSKSKQAIPETLFVKNIENVQGDERDVIIFSIGYAADKKGKVNVQFGSLNMAGGENRLNVAVTRARKKIIIITSIWAHQLETDDVKNDGPRLLKKYLEYAKAVSDGNYRLALTTQHHHAQPWYLKHRVIAWAAQRWANHQVEEASVPIYDLIVKQEEEPRGVLLLDDELYFNDLSAKAPHSLTPILLEHKNWPYLRIHSRNYWQDQERFFNEVSKLFITTD